MNKIDPVVKKETKYIALWVLLLSLLGEAVVLVIGNSFVFAPAQDSGKRTALPSLRRDGTVLPSLIRQQ